ncbi:hypothetical protein H632_c2580p0, partial [Helicosporidium sp. ATCC 50920]
PPTPPPDAPTGTPDGSPEEGPASSPDWDDSPGAPAWGAPPNIVKFSGVASAGSNSYGLLGTGDTTYTDTDNNPQLVYNGEAIPVAGGDFACMYTLSFVHCWGNNSVGQIGQPYSVDTTPSPMRVVGVDQPSRLSAGQQHVCLMEGNTPKCWGLNNTGQLGDGSTTNSHVPVDVNTSYEYRQLAAGYDHTCGLVSEASSADNFLQCWGNNASGQLGTGSASIAMTPATLSQKGWIWVAAGTSMTCAISADVYCWGANAAGQLGTGDTNQYNVPTVTVGTAGFTQVSTWGQTTCGIDGQSQMWCWGDGSLGQMGNKDYTDTNLTPVSVINPYATTFVSITSGGGHACGTDVAWQIYCWGDNTYGQLGTGNSLQTEAELFEAITGIIGLPSARNDITLYQLVSITPNPKDPPTPPPQPKWQWRKLLL